MATSGLSRLGQSRLLVPSYSCMRPGYCGILAHEILIFRSGPNTDLLGRRWFLVMGNLVHISIGLELMRSY